jgi:transposase-like protein
MDLQRRVEELTAENMRLREENAGLRRRLALYENPNTPPSRRIYPTRRIVRGGERFPGRPHGHRGVTRPRPRPDVVKAPEWRERCEGCGAPLGEPSYVDHRIVEEISNPHPRQVIDYLEFEWMCGACGSPTVARHPDCPPGGRLGKNVLVQATLMKFQERLPHWKVCEALERTYGLQVTPATVLDITRRVSGWLRPEYMRILRRIRSAEVVYVDETGVKVDGGRYWIWAFTTMAETLVSIRKSRGKKVLKEVLGEGFEGVVVCDGWRSYPSFTDRIQRCWAHLLREARCLAEQVEEARPLSEALHGIYRRFNVPPMDRPPPEEAMRLVEEARAAMEMWAGRPYEAVEVRRFAAKVLNGVDHWFTFLAVPGVEATNNRAERALREHVVQRKIMGCFRNGKGTMIYETVMTVLSTWKQQGRNLSQTLGEALTQEWTKS